MHTVFLIIGKSGAGKDTIVKELCDRYGYKRLISYTTRQRRYEGENTHTFISEMEYVTHRDNGDIVAYTFYNGNHYFATMGQLYECDLYVIDPAGVNYLKERAKHINLIGIYLDIDSTGQMVRMLKRGDRFDQAVRRIENDREAFANIDTQWHKINASNDPEIIIKEINKLMQKHLTNTK